MTERRFKLKYINEQHISANLYDNKTFIGSIGIGGELIVELLNNLSEENVQLKLELETHKHPLWSTREAERKVNNLTELLANETKKSALLLDEINALRKENKRLRAGLRE